MNPVWISKLCRVLDTSSDEISSILESNDDAINAFDSLMETYSRHAENRKIIWAEKTPNNCLRYQELAGMYPDLFFISTVRDGRDVVTSRVHGRSSYYVNNERFLSCAKAITSFHHPKHYVLRYENLVSRPDECIHELCSFLEIDYDSSILQRYREQTVTRDLSKVVQPKLSEPISNQWVRRWTESKHASRVRDFVKYPGVLELLKSTGYEHNPEDDVIIAYMPPSSSANIQPLPGSTGVGSDAGMGILSTGLDKKEQKRIHKVLQRELQPHQGERVITRQQALECCNYPPEAIEIIEGSSYNPNHGHVGLHRHIRASNVINDFFKPSDFQGKRIVEFGPGHYSFAMLARQLGAEVICIERHEEHARLGRVLGFTVIEKDFDDVTPEDLGGQVDGLWMKGAFNACRMPSDDSIADLAERMTSFLKPNGWAWCVTVNMLSKEDQPEDPAVVRCVEVQRLAFEQNGWTIEPINEDDRKRYAMSYKGCQYYFTRSLAPAPAPVQG